MFYLLKFKHENKEYLLYKNNHFVGGNSQQQAQDQILANTGKSLSIKGFEIIEVENLEGLKEIVSEYPYKIINFSGGIGIPFEGVLLKDYWAEFP